MKRFAIVASSDHLHAVREGESLPSLDARLKAVAREHFRRIDRFIQLAVIGAAECVRGVTLREDCGLYLSSGVGPVGSNTEVQRDLCRDHLLPKPFHFVNTLGSAAGHHVAKNVGLGGQNLFLSRRGEALAAALAIAATDLELGIVSQALLGVVEECTLPLEEHRRRQGLSRDVLMAEGSHWILLEHAPRPGAPTLTLERNAESACSPLPLLAFHDSRDAAALTHWLKHRPTPRLRLPSATIE